MPESKTQDGFEVHLATNHIGHFLLFDLLRDALEKGAAASADFASRVVVLSSSAHRMCKGLRFDDLNFKVAPYDKWAYAQSTLANIHFAAELEQRFATKGVHALSVHPGSIATALQKYIKDDPVFMAAKEDAAYTAQLKSVAQGAATSAWAAVARELEGKGGVYCEDTAEASKGQGPIYKGGYSNIAYDELAARSLWDVSIEMVRRK